MTGVIGQKRNRNAMNNDTTYIELLDIGFGWKNYEIIANQSFRFRKWQTICYYNMLIEISTSLF